MKRNDEMSTTSIATAQMIPAFDSFGRRTMLTR